MKLGIEEKQNLLKFYKSIDRLYKLKKGFHYALSEGDDSTGVDIHSDDRTWVKPLYSTFKDVINFKLSDSMEWKYHKCIETIEVETTVTELKFDFN